MIEFHKGRDKEVSAQQIEDIFALLKTPYKHADLYWKYLTDCHSYNKKNCPEIEFYYLDKLLYQLDIEKGNKVDNY